MPDAVKNLQVSNVSIVGRSRSTFAAAAVATEAAAAATTASSYQTTKTHQCLHINSQTQSLQYTALNAHKLTTVTIIISKNYYQY